MIVFQTTIAAWLGQQSPTVFWVIGIGLLFFSYSVFAQIKNPKLDAVQIISGNGQGMVRQCSHDKDKWTESCTLWEEGQKYSFEVNTEAEDYPYPLNYLKGSWEVEEVSELQTKVIMAFEIRYKRKIYNVLLHPFMKKKFKGICEELLDNWENEIINE